MSSNDPIQALRAMTTRLESVSGTASALQADVEHYARQQQKVNIIGAGFMAVVAVLLLIGAFMLVQLADISRTTREHSRQNGVLARQNAELGRQITDCTTPGGKCYERARSGGSGTRDAVASINRVTVAASWCAQRHDTIPEVERCVRTALQELAP